LNSGPYALYKLRLVKHTRYQLRHKSKRYLSCYKASMIVNIKTNPIFSILTFVSEQVLFVLMTVQVAKKVM
jgi:hypothetical protein